MGGFSSVWAGYLVEAMTDPAAWLVCAGCAWISGLVKRFSRVTVGSRGGFCGFDSYAFQGRQLLAARCVGLPLCAIQADNWRGGLRGAPA